MILVLALAAFLWAVGALLKLPYRARFYMIGLLYVGVLFIQIVLPQGHPLRLATGQSAALWIILGVFAALAAAYGRVVRALKARAVPPARATRPTC